MKILKKIITILISIVLLIVLGFNIFNYISIKILKNDLPTINGYAYLEVVSGSMKPKINIGDMIIIDTKIKEYKVKDIITFRDINGSYVTHRIIEITDDGYITKGDANNTIDDTISKEDVVGKYLYKINNIGAIMKSLRSPFNLFMILISGILICVLVSTDSKGNPILDKEKEEYFEFLDYKNNLKKQEKNNVNNNVLKKEDKVKIKDDNKNKKNEKLNNNKKSNSKKNNNNVKTNKKVVNKKNN